MPLNEKARVLLGVLELLGIFGLLALAFAENPFAALACMFLILLSMFLAQHR